MISQGLHFKVHKELELRIIKLFSSNHFKGLSRSSLLVSYKLAKPCFLMRMGFFGSWGLLIKYVPILHAY